jgi:voltage-gated potassium channel
MTGSLRLWLRSVVDGHNSRGSQIFDSIVVTMILLSAASFSIETLPDLTATQRLWLGWIERLVLITFTIEFAIRLWTAEAWHRYLFSFYGMIDLAAILPLLLLIGFDLTTLRLLRLIRLIHLLKLLRYNRAINRFLRAFAIAREEILLFSVITIILLYIAAVGIYHFEHQAQPEAFKSVFHSLWWAVATLTTVGYGDIYPVTIGGRLFTFIVLMVGLAVVAVPASVLASALAVVRIEEEREQGETLQRGARERATEREE